MGLAAVIALSPLLPLLQSMTSEKISWITEEEGEDGQDQSEKEDKGAESEKDADESEKAWLNGWHSLNLTSQLVTLPFSSSSLPEGSYGRILLPPPEHC